MRVSPGAVTWGGGGNKDRRVVCAEAFSEWLAEGGRICLLSFLLSAVETHQSLY